MPTSLSTCSVSPSSPARARGSPCGGALVRASGAKDCVADGAYDLSRDAPCCKAGADERLRAREIVDQLESLAAGRGVGDDPVADFVRAVAGARKRLGEKRGEP